MANFYTRPDSSHGGANDGTSYVDAWQGLANVSFGAIAGEVDAGDTLYVCGTHTNSSAWSVDHSGSVGLPITIRGDYPSDAGVLTNAKTLGSWTASGTNGEYWAEEPVGFTQVLKMLTRGGVPVNKFGTIGSLAAGSWKEDTVSTPNRIYYKPLASEVLTDHVWIVGGGFGVKTESAVTHDYIDFVNLTFSYYTSALTINNGGTHANDINTTGCTFSNNVKHFVYTRAQYCIIDDNTFDYAHSTGIQLGNPSIVGDSLLNSSFTNNIVKRGLWSNSETNTEGHAVDFSTNCSQILVQGNTFTEHCWCDGEGADGTYSGSYVVSPDGAQYISITGNLFYTNYIGCIQANSFDVADLPSGNYYITGNKFINNGLASSSSNRNNVITIYNGNLTSDDLQVYVVNNVFVGNKGATPVNNFVTPACVNIACAVGESLSGVYVHNNIFLNNENRNDVGIYNNAGTLSYSLGSNYYYRASGDYLSTSDGSTVVLYPSTAAFSSWVTATSDTSTIYDSSGDLDSNYIPSPDTPSYHSGDVVKFGVLDYKGHKFNTPPTIGAYEFTSGSVAQPREVA